MKTKLDFTKIREQLPHGSQTEIAKRANVHINVVHRVLHGQSKNVAVLTAIGDYLEDIKNKENSAISKIAAFIS